MNSLSNINDPIGDDEDFFLKIEFTNIDIHEHSIHLNKTSVEFFFSLSLSLFHFVIYPLK